jgi:hypothetical protein
MRRFWVAYLLLSAALLNGCVSLGWQFGPGFSMRQRRDLFAEPPVVEHRAQEYVLSWTQGDNPSSSSRRTRPSTAASSSPWWRRLAPETSLDVAGR